MLLASSFQAGYTQAQRDSLELVVKASFWVLTLGIALVKVNESKQHQVAIKDAKAGSLEGFCEVSWLK